METNNTASVKVELFFILIKASQTCYYSHVEPVVLLNCYFYFLILLIKWLTRKYLTSDTDEVSCLCIAAALCNDTVTSWHPSLLLSPWSTVWCFSAVTEFVRAELKWIICAFLIGVMSVKQLCQRPFNDRLLNRHTACSGVTCCSEATTCLISEVNHICFFMLKKYAAFCGISFICAHWYKPSWWSNLKSMMTA